MTRRDLLKRSLLLMATTAIPGKFILDKLAVDEPDMWSASTSDPMQDIINAKKAILANTGMPPDRIILSPERYKEWCEVFGIEPEYLKQANGMIEINADLI